MSRIYELVGEGEPDIDWRSVREEVIRWGVLIDGKREVQIEVTGAIGDRQAYLEGYIKEIKERGYGVLGLEGPIPIEDGKYLYKLELEKL